jgi:zinc D-Ala-D-Ala dipeptidase
VCDCVISAALRYLSGSSNWIDMGTGYDCLDSLAPADNGRIHGKQRANRMKLRKPMIAAGFKGLETEWWHFTLKNEPYPETFFDFPMEKASLR